MTGIAFVGAGSIVRRRHAPEFAEIPGVRIRGFLARGPQRAAALAARFGGRVYPDYAALLADPHVDAVCLCPPNRWHASMAVRAMEAGKHVLCEKPMATTVEDAEAMLIASRRTGMRLLIAHDGRFDPVNVRARELVQAGEIGKVLTFRTTFGHAGPEHWSADPTQGSWFFDQAEAGGGVLLDLGVHKAHLVSWLLGERIVEVNALAGVLAKQRADGRPALVEDNAVCVLRTESGALGTLTVSWTYSGGMDASTELNGTRGSLELHGDPRAPLRLSLPGREPVAIPVPEATSSGVASAFVAGLQDGAPTEFLPEEGLAALRVVLACLASARSGTMVKVR